MILRQMKLMVRVLFACHLIVSGPEDLEIHKKGVIASIRDFFINYKVPDGKPKNVLAFDGKILGRVLGYVSTVYTL